MTKRYIMKWRKKVAEWSRAKRRMEAKREELRLAREQKEGADRAAARERDRRARELEAKNRRDRQRHGELEAENAQLLRDIQDQIDELERRKEKQRREQGELDDEMARLNDDISKYTDMDQSALQSEIDEMEREKAKAEADLRELKNKRNELSDERSGHDGAYEAERRRREADLEEQRRKIQEEIKRKEDKKKAEEEEEKRHNREMQQARQDMIDKSKENADEDMFKAKESYTDATPQSDISEFLQALKATQWGDAQFLQMMTNDRFKSEFFGPDRRDRENNMLRVAGVFDEKAPEDSKFFEKLVGNALQVDDKYAIPRRTLIMISQNTEIRGKIIEGLRTVKDLFDDTWKDIRNGCLLPTEPPASDTWTHCRNNIHQWWEMMHYSMHPDDKAYTGWD